MNIRFLHKKWTAEAIFETEDGCHPENGQVQYAAVKFGRIVELAYFSTYYAPDGRLYAGSMCIGKPEENEILLVGDYETVLRFVAEQSTKGEGS